MSRVLLLGAGHAHAALLRALAAGRLADAEVMLVAPNLHPVYSGMLPGVVAGHYRVDEARLDFEGLARAAGARCRRAEAARLDPDRRIVTLSDGTETGYDFASLNLGARAALEQVPGAPAHAVSLKAPEELLARIDALEPHSGQGRRIAVVGAGAAGVEIAMALAWRFRPAAQIVLYSARREFAPPLARRIGRALDRCGVEVRADTAVARMSARSLVAADGRTDGYELVLWAAGAAPPDLLAASGLASDPQGFVAIDAMLRSLSHPEIFAAGDCATFRERPHPRSGVYAVRQGALLGRNLRAALRGADLERYVPQRNSLRLISCGTRYAVLDWGAIGAEGAWLWRVKDRIDRRWVRGMAQSGSAGG